LRVKQATETRSDIASRFVALLDAIWCSIIKLPNCQCAAAAETICVRMYAKRTARMLPVGLLAQRAPGVHDGGGDGACSHGSFNAVKGSIITVIKIKSYG
jgi:hypothetical protein